MNTPIVIELLFDDPVIAAEVLGQLEQREDAHHDEDGGAPRLDSADLIDVLDGRQFQARVTAAQGVGPWTDAERKSAGWPLLGRACLDREVASRGERFATFAGAMTDGQFGALCVKAGRAAAGRRRTLEELSARLEELEIELTRLRARARVEADDVERAGVTWAQLAAWAAAGETKAHMGTRRLVGYFAADGWEPQGSEAAEAIADKINWMVDECEPGRSALDILGEIAAASEAIP